MTFSELVERSVRVYINYDDGLEVVESVFDSPLSVVEKEKIKKAYEDIKEGRVKSLESFMEELND